MVGREIGLPWAETEFFSRKSELLTRLLLPQRRVVAKEKIILTISRQNSNSKMQLSGGWLLLLPLENIL